MRPIFHAELINRPFGDPGVFIDLKFERRAALQHRRAQTIDSNLSKI